MRVLLTGQYLLINLWRYNVLKVENILINGKEFIKTTSTQNKYIRQVQTGLIYAEAIDVASSTYIYEETDIEVESFKKSFPQAEEFFNDII